MVDLEKIASALEEAYERIAALEKENDELRKAAEAVREQAIDKTASFFGEDEEIGFPSDIPAAPRKLSAEELFDQFLAS